MDRKSAIAIAFAAFAGLSGIASREALAQEAPAGSFSYGKELLERVRQAAAAIPGDLPTSISYLKIAESHRTRAAVIEGGSDAPFISARTAFQVLYPAGSIMIDAGMDQAVHRFYGFGAVEPYWQDKNDAVQAALRQASMILITHEHGDHVAGVLRTAYRDELAPKTLLTRTQAETLAASPQLPEIRLTAEESRDYVIIDYARYLPVAPGIVLIKSPGHTPGHQMVYARLADRREYLFIGDIGWLIDNVIELKPRPEATIERIGEDRAAIMAQLVWIKELMDVYEIIVVPSHDDALLTRYGRARVLGTELMIQ